MNALMRSLSLALMAVSGSATAANSTIDVLVVYTNGVNANYASAPETRFNHLVAVTNQIYTDSNVPLQLNVAGKMQVNYSDDGSANTALNDVSKGTGGLSGVKAARDKVGADMVVFYRVYKNTHGSCGLAWVNSGTGSDKGDFSNKTYLSNYMFAHIGVTVCPDFVTAHELGHNMGLTHSRLQDGRGAAFPYATGYGVAGKFVETMAYSTSFNVAYGSNIYKFSSPDLTCMGEPCGVDRNDPTNGADSAYAITQTGAQIAGFNSINAKSDRYAELTTQLPGLLSAVTVAKAARVAKQQEIATATAAVRSASSVLASKKAALNTATAALNKVRTTVATVTKALATANTKLVSAQQAAAKTSGTAATKLATQATTLQTQIATLTQQLETATAAISPAETAVTNAAIALTAATSALSDATTALNALKAELAPLVAAEAQAVTAYNTAKKEYDTLKKIFG